MTIQMPVGTLAIFRALSPTLSQQILVVVLGGAWEKNNEEQKFMEVNESGVVKPEPGAKVTDSQSSAPRGNDNFCLLTTNGIFPHGHQSQNSGNSFFFFAMSFSLSFRSLKQHSYFSPIFVINSPPGLRFLFPECPPSEIRDT